MNTKQHAGFLAIFSIIDFFILVFISRGQKMRFSVGSQISKSIFVILTTGFSTYNFFSIAGVTSSC